ncbi:MAG: glycosyl transferase, family 2 [Cytophagales bacterium]|jgi:GT2 family glycosyltransferase|nr:glycosyltransferase family 2 protein [Bacteroidota bacterium]WHZ09001.1 MAG: glycosyl transferase, family 2 [Cytophagales bacterium]
MKKITASIVIYKNNLIALRKTLNSFFNSTLKGDLYVIDNSPSDVARELCTQFQIQYVHNPKNVGFGLAHNSVIDQCVKQSLYHLVLNPDVFFDAHVLEELYEFMEHHPEAGMVMPKVLYPDGSIQKLCRLLPTPIDLFVRRFFPFKNWFKKMNDTHEMFSCGYNKIMNVPFLSGCFMFIRTSVFERVGTFDKRFFLYAEDIDLSRRIHWKFKTYFYPYVKVVHVHARGSYKTLRLTWQNIKSAVLYFNKWGWFIDYERRIINKQALENIKLLNDDTLNISRGLVRETIT